MTRILALLLLASIPIGVLATPPTLDIPEEVKAQGGAYAFIPKDPSIKSVKYIGISGAEPFDPTTIGGNPNAFLFLPGKSTKDGVYRFIAVGSSADGDQATKPFSLKVGDAPIPPPGPNPPGPDPNPVPVTTFQVMLIRETGVNLTPAQNGVFHGVQVEKWLDEKTTKDGPTRGWRRHDKDDGTTNDTPKMNQIWSSIKGALKPDSALPCVALFVNDKIYLEPLPETPAAAIDLFTKYLNGQGGK